MNTSQLIQFLATFPADMPVVMSCDGEGNSFSPFSEASTEWYVSESTWSGYIVDPEEVEDNEPEAVLTLVLWPVN